MRDLLTLCLITASLILVLALVFSERKYKSEVERLRWEGRAYAMTIENLQLDMASGAHTLEEQP